MQGQMGPIMSPGEFHQKIENRSSRVLANLVVLKGVPDRITPAHTRLIQMSKAQHYGLMLIASGKAPTSTQRHQDPFPIGLPRLLAREGEPPPKHEEPSESV